VCGWVWSFACACALVRACVLGLCGIVRVCLRVRVRVRVRARVCLHVRKRGRAGMWLCERVCACEKEVKDRERDDGMRKR